MNVSHQPSIPSLVSRGGKAFFKLCGLTRETEFVKGKKLPYEPAEIGNTFIRDAISLKVPFLFGRFGTPESNACLNRLEMDLHRSGSLADRLRAEFYDLRRDWDPNVRQVLETNVGFFPTDEANVERFVTHYTAQLKTVDALAYWGWVPGESLLIHRHCPKTRLFKAMALEPYLLDQPWSELLRGKRVLVIHPFRDSILTQYKKRELLFSDPAILPEFDLRVIRAVQSLAGTETPFSSWFEALESMKTQMELEPFDVCLVGAGSYGLALCAHAKKLGSAGLQIGGGLQILFGIIGKRWESMPHISRHFNQHWVRPSVKERIPSGNKIEDGCYW